MALNTLLARVGIKIIKLIYEKMFERRLGKLNVSSLRFKINFINKARQILLIIIINTQSLVTEIKQRVIINLFDYLYYL